MRALLNGTFTFLALFAGFACLLELAGPPSAPVERPELVALVGSTGPAATTRQLLVPAATAMPLAPRRTVVVTSPVDVSARLERVHVARGPDGLALMLDFSSTVNFQTEYREVGNQFGIVVSPVDREALAAHLAELSEALGPAVVLTESSWVHQVSFDLLEGVMPSTACRAAAGQGRTLLLDFERSKEDPAAETLVPVSSGKLSRPQKTALGRGLDFFRYRWTGTGGSGSNVFVHRVDPTRGNFDVRLALAKDRIHARQTLSEMASERRAVAAINAGFFAINGNGDPLGLLVKDGEVLAAPIFARSAIGLFPDGRVLFGNPELSGRIRTGRGELSIDGLNQARQPGKLVLYTHHYGASTRTEGPGFEAAVAGGRLLVRGSCDLPIPPGGYVLSYLGQVPAVLRDVSPGDPIAFQYGLTPPWNSSTLAVGGGPRLVREGRAVVSGEAERFSRSFAMERAPRTGVGLTAGGKLLLVAVDGRRPRTNAGVSLPELAAIFISLGAVDALNMDGGGSTTFWTGGQVVNSPSDGRERPITSALTVLERAPVRLATTAAGAG